jgi:hypothetical protein
MTHMIDESRQEELWFKIWNEAKDALSDNLGYEVDDLENEMDITRIAYNIAITHLVTSEQIMKLKDRKVDSSLTQTKTDFYKGYAESLENEIHSLKEEIVKLKSKMEAK